MAGRKIFSLFGSIVIEGMGKSKKDLTALDKDIRATNRALNKMGKEAAKVGKFLTKSFTVPLGIAAIAAVKFGADFDKAMTNSLAIMTDVSDAMRKDLENTAREVAKTTIFSAKEAADAYYFLASAGLTAAQSIKMLPKVAAFAQAGNFDLAKATDLLTDAQSALGLASDDTSEHMENTARVSDVLVQAAKSANASVMEFSEGLTNKAGVALKLLNKDVEEGVAVLQVYADKGLAKGADAGTQLNIVLRDLQNAATKNKQAFTDAGIAVFDTDGKMRHVADIVEDLDNRLGSMTDEQKRSELMMLGFTSKSIDATSALLGTSDAIRAYEKDLKSAGGVTQEVADKQMKTFWAQMGLLKDRVIDLGLTLYEVLGPALMEYVVPAFDAVIKAIASMIEWFGRHKNISIFTGTLVAALTAVGPLALAFAKLVPLMKKMYATYKLLISGQLTLNAVMKANPMGFIIAGITLLIASGVLLWKNWDTIKAKFIDVWDGIKYHFANIANWIIIKHNLMIVGILKGINLLAKHIPGLGKSLTGLIDQMDREIAVIKATKDARIAANKAQKIANKLTKEEVKILDEAKKAVEKKSAAEKKAVEEKKKLTLEQQKLAKKAAEDKAKLEEDWTKKLFEQSASRLESLEAEKLEALQKAKDLKADTADIEKYYATEKTKLEKETVKRDLAIKEQLAKDKISLLLDVRQAEIDIMEEGSAKNQAQLQLDLDRLQLEKDEAVKMAIEKGLALVNITKTFAAKEVAINKKANLQQAKDDKALKDKKIKTTQTALGFAAQTADIINKIWGVSTEKQMADVDKEKENKIAAVEASVMSEEERAAAIDIINTEAAAKKLELQKENARREKMMAIFSIILNTAMAISSALGLFPPPLGIAMAIIVGALGIAQIAIAVAQPMPLAEGGLIKSSPGKGVMGQIGEGTQDELVLPMKTGVEELANNLIGKLSSMGAGVSIAGAVKAVPIKARELHLHIGMLIADEFGIKTFAKKINKYLVAESQRTGGAYGTA